MAKKISKNEVFGTWKLKKFLGGGGNGDVWLAVNNTDQEGAIKLLRKIERKTYERFINEIRIMNKNDDIDGVLPVLDSYLPDRSSEDVPWYVMPVAQPLEKYLDGKRFEDIASAIIEVGKTLFELHRRNISHRDIKPENILVKDGKIYLGDFGLVDYPEKNEITSYGDVIGAKWTMAPEMRREGRKADGKSADVYSLAKTFWILVTKVKKGFDGQYDPLSVNGLSRLQLMEDEKRVDIYIEDKYRAKLFLKPIDDLLRDCTSDSPTQRPTIQYFIETLSWWVDSHKELDVRNPIEWQDVQKQLFPSFMPQRAVWENTNDIASILNIIGSIRALNHMFYPEGGGMDLEGAKIGFERNTVELIIDINSIELIKPKRLIFESFNSDPQWNYFLIETEFLEPTGIGNIYHGKENLIEIEPLHYISRQEWDAGYFEKGIPSGNIRYVTRYSMGNFVIFAKKSYYNHASSTYDARHNQLSVDEFRTYITQKVEIAESLLRDKGLAKLAKEKDLTMNEVLTRFFEDDFYKDNRTRFRENDDE